MIDTPTIEDVKRHIDLLSGASFADGAFSERGGRAQNSELANTQIAISGAAIINRFRTQAEHIARLEASVDLFHRCYEAARGIWRKDHPERAKLFDPSGEKAIAAMIAEHSFWEKHSLTGLCERNSALKDRVAELESEVTRLTACVEEWQRFTEANYPEALREARDG